MLCFVAQTDAPGRNQYIPLNFIKNLLLIKLNSLWIHDIHLPIPFRVTSLALGQSCDWSSNPEGYALFSCAYITITCRFTRCKSNIFQPNHNKVNHVHIPWDILYIALTHTRYERLSVVISIAPPVDMYIHQTLTGAAWLSTPVNNQRQVCQY